MGWPDGVLQNEAESELAWARSRPTSRSSDAVASASVSLSLSTFSSSSNMFELALNSMEYDFLQNYRKMWPNSAYQLNQDPTSGHGHHAPDDFQLFTLISNFGLVWGEHANRWLMPTEALVCQHFPVVPKLHDPLLELTPFHLRNPHRSGRHVFTQVGNSMRCGVMALLQLHSLSEVRHPQVPSLFRNIRLARLGPGVMICAA